MEKRVFNSIKERLDFIEFRQQLLFDNDELSRLLFEYQITQDEYFAIMDLMDEFRSKLDKHQDVNSGEFEGRIYEIVPSCYGDYHFCEFIAKAFYEDGRWEEVFPALYGKSPKYSYLFKKD